MEKVLKVSEKVFQVKGFGCDRFVGFWKDFECLKEGFLGFEGICKVLWVLLKVLQTMVLLGFFIRQKYFFKIFKVFEVLEKVYG